MSYADGFYFTDARYPSGEEKDRGCKNCIIFFEAVSYDIQSN